MKKPFLRGIFSPQFKQQQQQQPQPPQQQEDVFFHTGNKI